MLKQYQRYHLWFDLVSDWKSSQWYCTSPLEGSYGVLIQGHYCVLVRIPIPMFAFSFQVFCFLCQMSVIGNKLRDIWKCIQVILKVSWYMQLLTPLFLDFRLTANLNLVLITTKQRNCATNSWSKYKQAWQTGQSGVGWESYLPFADTAGTLNSMYLVLPFSAIEVPML